MAEVWDISTDEAVRVRMLMKGIRGAISVKNLSPYEVLGIHAKSEAERTKYAERMARMMAEDTERVMAFNRAYLAAFARMYPNAKLFDPTTLAASRANAGARK